MYVCSKERMEDKIKTFSKFGDAGHGGITRYSLSPEAIMARNEFLKRMKAIGADIEIDDVANIYATHPGSDPDAKRIVMASHVDSVKNGGNYDGILGVMSAMEVLEDAGNDIGVVDCVLGMFNYRCRIWQSLIIPTQKARLRALPHRQGLTRSLMPLKHTRQNRLSRLPPQFRK